MNNFGVRAGERKPPPCIGIVAGIPLSKPPLCISIKGRGTTLVVEGIFNILQIKHKNQDFYGTGRIKFLCQNFKKKYD